MKHLLIILSLLFLNGSFSFGQQSYKEDKHFKKTIKYYKAGDYNKAIAEMRFVLDKYENEYDVWEIAINLYYERYYKAPKSNDLMMDQLMQALKDSNKKKGNQNITLTMSSPKDEYFYAMVNLCREATLKRRHDLASMYIRVLLVDDEPEVKIPEKAMAYHEEAEKNFQDKNFNKALENYEKAIQEFPQFYKAVLYKGDTYYHLKDYKNAIVYYTKGEALAPGLLEPVKYLTDAYYKDGQYDESMNACIKGIILYPDVSMFAKLEDIAEIKEKKMEDHWLQRKCYPNRSFRNTAPTSDPTWKVYQEAKAKIQSYCDTSGAIITKNDLTSQQFMETYCWEEMLKTATGKEFDFAKKMKEEGYLDCYVFITMYHYDIQKQYKQFALNNDERIRTYINKYVLK